MYIFSCDIVDMVLLMGFVIVCPAVHIVFMTSCIIVWNFHGILRMCYHIMLYETSSLCCVHVIRNFIAGVKVLH